MLKNDLVAKNPLSALHTGKDGQVIAQRLGTVIARAGVGKTAILVQIALDYMLRGKQVVHVSIGQNIEKTKSWYDDIICDIAAGAKQENTADIKFEVMRNRMIMTFKEATFNRPKLEERLNDLIYQDIFRPCCMVIDGLDAASIDRQMVADLRELAHEASMNIWFSANSQRAAQDVAKTGAIPEPCDQVADLLDTVIMLQPESNGESKIFLNVLKDNAGSIATGKTLRLDPTSLLVWGSTF